LDSCGSQTRAAPTDRAIADRRLGDDRARRNCEAAARGSTRADSERAELPLPAAYVLTKGFFELSQSRGLQLLEPFGGSISARHTTRSGFSQRAAKYRTQYRDTPISRISFRGRLAFASRTRGAPDPRSGDGKLENQTPPSYAPTPPPPSAPRDGSPAIPPCALSVDELARRGVGARHGGQREVRAPDRADAATP